MRGKRTKESIEKTKNFSQTSPTTTHKRTLQVHVLFIHGFESQKQGTTESKKHDHKHYTEARHVSVNHHCQCSGVQTSGATERRKRLIKDITRLIATEQCSLSCCLSI